MRAFIAIDIPEEIKSEIARIQKNLPEFSGKKTELENLHLTLKFLGEISEEQADKVRKKLSEIKFKKFEAEISELGVFNENFVRIVWIKLEGCENIQEEVDRKLEGLFPRERRFMSHLTIARIKKIKDRKKFISELGKIKINHTKLNISDFFLKKSILTGEKPVYEALGRYDLI